MTDEDLDNLARVTGQMTARQQDGGNAVILWSALADILAECRRARAAEREMAILFGDRLQDDALAVAERQAVLVWLRGRSKQHFDAAKETGPEEVRNMLDNRAIGMRTVADEIEEGLHASPDFVATLEKAPK